MLLGQTSFTARFLPQEHIAQKSNIFFLYIEAAKRSVGPSQPLPFSQDQMRAWVVSNPQVTPGLPGVQRLVEKYRSL